MNGQQIIVTRAVQQAGALNDLLRRHGAVPLLYPCISTLPLLEYTALDTALQRLEQFDWLVLTSANTVRAVAQRLSVLDRRAPLTLPVAAVGPTTAQLAQRLLGSRPALVPDEYVAEALAGALHPAAGARILLPQADIARDTLAASLTSGGADVTVVSAYRTGIGSGGVQLASLLARAQVDAITFTSSSTVHNCVRRLVGEGGTAQQLSGLCIATIGPATRQTVYGYGLDVTIMPDEHTLDALVAALSAHFAPISTAASTGGRRGSPVDHVGPQLAEQEEGVEHPEAARHA